MSSRPDTQSPTVSVLLPVYNGSSFLDTTISCLLNQTWTDFEIIACDDASTDDSWDVLQKWAEQDQRIRLICHSGNKGVYETQKDLAREASGQFIAQQDQDDYSAPTRLETQVKLLRENPEASGTVSNVWLVDEEGDPIGITNLPATAELLTEAMKHDNVCIHSTLMMRRDVFNKIEGYRKEADHVADYDLMLRLLQQGPLIPCEQPLATYGLSPGTVTYRDRATQVALAQEIRHHYFGAPKPEVVHHTPLTREQARKNYHYEVGRMYLAKANMPKARFNLQQAFKLNPGLNTGLLYLASHLPCSAISALKRLKSKGSPNNHQDPVYFLDRTRNPQNPPS
jgi:glycosyltransferase involved in cell wall biosynthesis